MSTAAPAGARPRPRLSAVLREEARVTPLELFFDLVFVLALTQCTALMAETPTWEGIGRAMVLLGSLWWAWGGYTWLTSVIDPEEGAVRVVFFAAMAAMLVAGLCVPDAFGDTALGFALALAAVRALHLVLFRVASRDSPDMRRSVGALAVGTAIGMGLLIGGSFADPGLQLAIWAVALVLDMGGPYVFGAGGWTLIPGHFAERYGLILIVALGESVVAIGVGAEKGVDGGVVVAATLSVAVVAALWWLYFDVVALVAERRLARAAEGLERNAIARDSYAYLHLPMIAGIVLIALGFKKTLGDVGEPLKLVPAFALLGGTAAYLLAHVAFRLRNMGTLSVQRLVCAVLLLALVPVAHEVPALAALGTVAAVLVALIAYEALRFAEARDRVRHQLATEGLEARARRADTA
ncbi:MAG TPA: low temperature requirement protein A [Solirubrobacteraceae bacterium]